MFMEVISMKFIIKKSMIYLVIISSVLNISCADKNITSNENQPKYSLEIIQEDGYAIESNAYIYDGMMRITNGKEGNEKRYGYMDTLGKVAIEPVYLNTVSFSDGLVFVKKDAEKGYYLNKKGDLVIEKVNGEILGLGDLFKNGYAVVYSQVEKNGATDVRVINKNGDVLLSSEITQYNFSNIGHGYFEKFKPSDYQARMIIDYSGKVIYSNGASLIFPSNDASGFFTFDNEVYGIVYNNTFQEPIFQSISEFVDNRALVVDLEGTVYLIDSEGNKKANLSEVYSNIDKSNLNVFSNSVVALNFLDDQSAVIIDAEGLVVKNTDLNHIFSYDNGIALCMKNGKYGYVDAMGNIILEPVYDIATNCSDGIGFVRKEEQWYRFELISLGNR